MPKVNKGESKSHYINRCIPYVINEGKTKDPKRAFAICNGLYEDGKLVDLIKLIDDNTK